MASARILSYQGRGTPRNIFLLFLKPNFLSKFVFYVKCITRECNLDTRFKNQIRFRAEITRAAPHRATHGHGGTLASRKYYVMYIMTPLKWALSRTGYQVSDSHKSCERTLLAAETCGLAILSGWSDWFRTDGETREMHLLLYAVLLMSALATCKACSCSRAHPQEIFCGAHFGKLVF